MYLGSPGGSVVKNPPANLETQGMWIRFLGGEDTLEVEMATHPIFLPGEIPQTEEPGRLHSMGLYRVAHA